MSKKVAIIGSVGVPASYGGFETLVENIIGDNCSADVEYTVFCSARHYHIKHDRYKGAKLRYIPLNANGVSSILYDGISLLKSIRGYDAVVVLGVSGGIFFPLFKLLSQIKLIVNIDGLEWKRGKWKGFAKFFLRVSEEFALRFSDVVIADNKAIVKYIENRYSKQSVLIAYGGDHVKRDLTQGNIDKILSRYHLSPSAYDVNVCRIEVENNCDMILKCYAESGDKIVMIGNFSGSKYGVGLKEKYGAYSNIVLLDAIYDLDILYALRSSCRYYIHGHSAGGSNPSLIEAMFCGCNILAFDVDFNRNTTWGLASYFATKAELQQLLSERNENNKVMMKRAEKLYTWHEIAKKYEFLY